MRRAPVPPSALASRLGLCHDQSRRAALVERMNPITQRLTVHATDARRRLAVLAIAYRRQGQQSRQKTRPSHPMQDPAKAKAFKKSPANAKMNSVYA